MNTEAFKSINLTYDSAPHPACEAYEFLTDNYWKCMFYQQTMAAHVAGTCSLGRDAGDSDTSVVDTKFRFEGN